MNSEGRKREADLDQADEMVKDLQQQVREQAALITQLQEAASKPKPAVEFGQKGQEYTALAFRFGAKLLNCKLTCQSAADVLEIVYGELFPHHKGRLPPREQFETWRRQLYLWCRWAITDTLQNKCQYVHLSDDATTKGKSVASRKTQIHLTDAVVENAL